MIKWIKKTFDREENGESVKTGGKSLKIPSAEEVEQDLVEVRLRLDQIKRQARAKGLLAGKEKR